MRSVPAHGTHGPGHAAFAVAEKTHLNVRKDELDRLGVPAGPSVRRFQFSEILQPRAEEIFHLLWDEIRRAGFEKSLNSGIVLTGGGAMLEGMAEIAEQIFDLPIRRGAPAGLGGLADHVSSPAFATAVGLVMYAHRNHVGEPARPVGAGAFGRVAGRLRTLFKEFF